LLNGLDLFSGIGGLSIALKEWVRPIAYCEIDPYCQGVLLAHQSNGRIQKSPIWDDVRSFPSNGFAGIIDIIYGGFPCQDISIAGHGKGLAGERSGLFFEIVRLAKEIKPKFIFLENVPAICSRGGIRVVREITEVGYDCRWCVISAASIGALHRRERWFLLAYAKHDGSHGTQKRGSTEKTIHDCTQGEDSAKQSEGSDQSGMLASESISKSRSKRLEGHRDGAERSSEKESVPSGIPSETRILNYWKNTEPPVCGIPHGVPNRVDRIRALGNAVVPSQAKKAFKILMGFKGES
jgi:DNA (cytosine-5)-methyltransferase 1